VKYFLLIFCFWAKEFFTNGSGSLQQRRGNPFIYRQIFAEQEKPGEFFLILVLEIRIAFTEGSALAISVASIPPNDTPTIIGFISFICSFKRIAYAGRDSFFSGEIQSIKTGSQNDKSRKEKALLSAPRPLMK
jgi:hypothetical protein